MRLTPSNADPLDRVDQEQTRIVGAICKALVRRATEYFVINEWTVGLFNSRHQHFLLIGPHRWHEDELRPLIFDVIERHRRKSPEREWHANLRVEPIEHAEAIGRYIVKDLKANAKKCRPPGFFKSHVATVSGGFLIRSKAELWRQCCREWHGPTDDEGRH